MNDNYLSAQLTSVSSNIGYCTSNNVAINNTGCFSDNAVINSLAVNGTLVCRCDTTYTTQSNTIDIQLNSPHELEPLKFLPL